MVWHLLAAAAVGYLLDEQEKEKKKAAAAAEETKAWEHEKKKRKKAAKKAAAADAERRRLENVNAFFNSGLNHANNGNHDEAIACYTEVIRLSPNCADAFNNRGIGYWAKGDYQKASTDFTAAIRLDPNCLAAQNIQHLKAEQAEREKREGVKVLVSCPSCGQSLRVPLGLGTLTITCHCGNKWDCLPRAVPAEDDYYEILEVSRNARPERIQAAFRSLANEYHPDKGKHPDGERMRLIIEAYEVLSDPDRRREYDART